LRKWIFAVLMLGAVAGVRAEETTLFDPRGNPVAYFTDDLGIYTWNGDATSYLSGADGRFSIYAYNGTHLGWLINGMVYDHKANWVGFTKSAGTGIITSVEPGKGGRMDPPNKLTQEFAPPDPIPTRQWSSIELESLLRGDPQ
jgi:hypothetical protein